MLIINITLPVVYWHNLLKNNDGSFSQYFIRIVNLQLTDMGVLPHCIDWLIIPCLPNGSCFRITSFSLKRPLFVLKQKPVPAALIICTRRVLGMMTISTRRTQCLHFRPNKLPVKSGFFLINKANFQVRSQTLKNTYADTYREWRLTLLTWILLWPLIQE